MGITPGSLLPTRECSLRTPGRLSRRRPAGQGPWQPSTHPGARSSKLTADPENLKPELARAGAGPPRKASQRRWGRPGSGDASRRRPGGAPTQTDLSQWLRRPDCQGSICVGQTRLLSGQRGLLGSLCFGRFTPSKSQGTSFVRTGKTKVIRSGGRPSPRSLWSPSAAGHCGQQSLRTPATAGR